MFEWWDALGTTAQVYWGIAIVSSVILFLQTALMFVGGDADADVDTDFDTGDGAHDAGVHLISIRGIIAFFTGFGWGGVSGIGMDFSLFMSTMMGLGFGAVMLFGVAYMMALFHSLAESGNLKMQNAIGQSGTVYIRIPGKRGGKGQVTLLVQGQTRQLEAVTDHDEEIPSGAGVKIVETLPDNSVLVEIA